MSYLINQKPTAYKKDMYRGRIVGANKDRKQNAQALITEQNKEQSYFNEPLHLEVGFYFPLSANVKRLGIGEGDYHFYRPDTSNCIKFVEDACESILFKNDCIISSIYATKQYSDRTYTQFDIMPLSQLSLCSECKRPRL